MGKMSDLDLQIRELRSCGETIIEIANTLAGMFYSAKTTQKGGKNTIKTAAMTDINRGLAKHL